MRNRGFGWFGEMMLILPYAVGICQLVGLLIAWAIRSIWGWDYLDGLSSWGWLVGFAIWLWLLWDEWKWHHDYKKERRSRRKRMPRWPGEKV